MNTITSLSSSPLILRKFCFSRNFFPNRYLQGRFFFMLLSVHKFLTILFIAIAYPSSFSQLNISLGVAVYAASDHPWPPIYKYGDWIRSPVPARAKLQRVEFGTEEPRVSRDWRSSRPRHGSGERHYEGKAWGAEGPAWDLRWEGLGGKGSQQRGGLSRIPGPGSGVVSAARGREDEAGGRGANKPTSPKRIVCGVGRAQGSVRSVNGLKQERGAKRSLAVDQKLEAALERL